MREKKKKMRYAQPATRIVSSGTYVKFFLSYQARFFLFGVLFFSRGKGGGAGIRYRESRHKDKSQAWKKKKKLPLPFFLLSSSVQFCVFGFVLGGGGLRCTELVMRINLKSGGGTKNAPPYWSRSMSSSGRFCPMACPFIICRICLHMYQTRRQQDRCRLKRESLD